MILVFHPDALEELDDATSYYGQIRPSLSQKFQKHTAAAIDRILIRPLACPSIEFGARRYRLRKFPYGIVYKADDRQVVIYAFMHLMRRPGYWRNRLRPH